MNLLTQESLAWVRYLTDFYFFSSVLRQLEQEAHLNSLRELAAAANNTEWKIENRCIDIKKQIIKKINDVQILFLIPMTRNGQTPCLQKLFSFCLQLERLVEN